MPISDYLKDLRSSVGHTLLLMPGVDALIFNGAGWVLLLKRSDNGLWSLPGGTLEPSEPPALAVMREVWEEVGLKVVPTRLRGVFGGVGAFHVRYPNADELAPVVTLFECRVVGGTLGNRDGEATEVRYFPLDALPELTDIAHYLLERVRGDVLFDWNESWLEALA